MSAGTTSRVQEITFEEYLRSAADFCEWVGGQVVQISPVTSQHDRLTRYLARLLESYFELKPIGPVAAAPFVMRLPGAQSAREPDLQVILDTNPGEFTETFMNGPADICIEVVSEESVRRDHGEKFEEYERGGVREYWIIDPLHRECRFYRLDAHGRYTRHTEDASGDYRTPGLPQLVLHVPTLWQEVLPLPAAVVEAVRTMLA